MCSVGVKNDNRNHKYQCISREFLAHYANEWIAFIDFIVMGDKTWAYHFIPEPNNNYWSRDILNLFKKKEIQRDIVYSKKLGYCFMEQKSGSCNRVYAH